MITWCGCPVSANDGQMSENRVRIYFSNEEQQDHYNASFPMKNFELSFQKQLYIIAAQFL